ncbi:MAG TPA: CapA family protein [Candidatus Limnocylindrales bacterium]
MVRVALAGDTMLGRGVGQRLLEVGPKGLFTRGVTDAVADADLFLLNLECCISDRGTRWGRAGKPFFFRAPPVAAHTLSWLGVDCVNLANNHALDFGPDALADTIAALRGAGIACVGAGADERQARAPAVITVGAQRVAIIGATDHPEDYAAGPGTPGVAYADLDQGVPDWLRDAIANADADLVIVTVHWGPNMTTEPMGYIRSAARELREAGATLVAGHSAHVFHGVQDSIIFDLGDFIDDYAVDSLVHNDLGVIMLADLDTGGLTRLEVIPIALDYALTRRASPSEYAWIRERFTSACEEFGTAVTDAGDRLVVSWADA